MKTSSDKIKQNGHSDMDNHPPIQRLSRPTELLLPKSMEGQGWEHLPDGPAWIEGDDFLGWGKVDDRVSMAIYRQGENKHVGARVWYGPGSRGGPGQVHGGAISAVLDQMLGFAAWQEGVTSVTARLTVNYRGRVPLGTLAWVEAWVEQTEARKILTRGTMKDDNNQLLADAEGLFVLVSKEYFKEGKNDLPERMGW